MNRYKLIGILSIILFSGCAIQKQIIVEKKPFVSKIPVGIDSTTSVIADSIYFLISVVEQDENEARKFFDQALQISAFIDTIWNAKENGIKTAGDSSRTLRALNEVDIYLRSNPEEYKQIQKSSKKYGRLNKDVLTSISKTLISQTISVFETCIRKNKFKVEYRRQYSQFLKDSYQKINDKNLLVRSGDELEKIVKYNRDNRVLYSDLATIYWDLGQWQDSFDNFEEAKTALTQNAIFGIENPYQYYDRLTEVPIDTNRMVGYISRQAECKIKLYEDKPALALLEEAKELTPSQEYKSIFDARITWINWDAGNIRAVEIRDKADSLWHAKKNPAAAKLMYLDLLPILRLSRTNAQINWNIATIDFYHLDNKAEGVSRMMMVRKNTQIDSLTGAPVDSSFQRYLDAYGAMCYQLGSQYLNSDLNYAYIYYSQAAHTNFKDRSKAYLQLADMSKFDPIETIRLCNKSIECNETIDDQSKKFLYQLLFSSYKKLGDFETSKKWYDLWRQL